MSEESKDIIGQILWFLMFLSPLARASSSCPQTKAIETIKTNWNRHELEARASR